jgi:hypothetical protein
MFRPLYFPAESDDDIFKMVYGEISGNLQGLYSFCKNNQFVNRETDVDEISTILKNSDQTKLEVQISLQFTPTLFKEDGLCSLRVIYSLYRHYSAEQRPLIDMNLTVKENFIDFMATMTDVATKCSSEPIQVILNYVGKYWKKKKTVPKDIWLYDEEFCRVVHHLNFASLFLIPEPGVASKFRLARIIGLSDSMYSNEFLFPVADIVSVLERNNIPIILFNNEHFIADLFPFPPYQLMNYFNTCFNSIAKGLYLTLCHHFSYRGKLLLLHLFCGSSCQINLSGYDRQIIPAAGIGVSSSAPVISPGPDSALAIDASTGCSSSTSVIAPTPDSAAYSAPATTACISSSSALATEQISGFGVTTCTSSFQPEQDTTTDVTTATLPDQDLRPPITTINITTAYTPEQESSTVVTASNSTIPCEANLAPPSIASTSSITAESIPPHNSIPITGSRASSIPQPAQLDLFKPYVSGSNIIDWTFQDYVSSLSHRLNANVDDFAGTREIISFAVKTYEETGFPTCPELIICLGDKQITLPFLLAHYFSTYIISICPVENIVLLRNQITKVLHNDLSTEGSQAHFVNRAFIHVMESTVRCDVGSGPSHNLLHLNCHYAIYFFPSRWNPEDIDSAVQSFNTIKTISIIFTDIDLVQKKNDGIFAGTLFQIVDCYLLINLYS